VLIQPITSRQTGINIWSCRRHAAGVPSERSDGDPNHLGIELVIPLLVLTPLYLRLERGHRWRTPLAVLLVHARRPPRHAVTSALSARVRGAVPLPYRRLPAAPGLPRSAGGRGVVVGAVVLVRQNFFLTVLRARTNTSRGAASPHFAVYGFVPDILSAHPFLGLGLNNFAVYYQFVTGRPDFGPHSFYVATIVETGIVGGLLFAAFVVGSSSGLVRSALGRVLPAAGDPFAARVRPLAWA
jgi:hypothetical protein